MLAYVPVVGWSWLMSDVVFLARDWEKDKLKLAEGVKQVHQVICKRPIIHQRKTLNATAEMPWSWLVMLSEFSSDSKLLIFGLYKLIRFLYLQSKRICQMKSPL